MWNFFRQKERFSSFWYGDLSPTAIACLNSFGARGFNFDLYTYGAVKNIPKFVRRRDAARIVPKERLYITHDGVEHFSDVFRYELLRQLGGWWSDTDVVCNTNVVPSGDIAFADLQADLLGVGQLKFPPNHPLIIEVIDFIGKIDDPSYGTKGPDAFTKVVAKSPSIGIHKWSRSDMYPIKWAEAVKFIFPEFAEEINQRTETSKFIHIYTSSFRHFGFDDRRFLPLKGSYLDLLYERHGVERGFSELRPIDEKCLRQSVHILLQQEWFQKELVDADLPSSFW